VSQENVETVRASFQAYNAGDMKAWGALLDPEVVWAAFEAGPRRKRLLVGKPASANGSACERRSTSTPWSRSPI
jgi:ketosteroid isomerase-like protein